MTKVIMMGTGAAPGVPALAKGWGRCDPNNPKNRRRRIGTYIDFGTTKFLIDTSPDLRQQLLDNNIRFVDAVLYTHAHADHLHGIDDLRELNRISGKPIDVYALSETMKEIKERFSYLLKNECSDKGAFCASLTPHILDQTQDCYIGDVKIGVLELSGHMVPSNGYVFNDGEIVYIADCKQILKSALKKIKIPPKLLIMPLTVIKSHYDEFYHMELDKLLEYVNLIKPKRTLINHMAIECDYEEVNSLTPDDVQPAFDNMVIEF